MSKAIKPKKDEFRLSKVKRIKNGGLEVEWTIQTTDNDEINTDNDKRESTREPHNDLVVQLKALKPIFAKVINFDWWKEATNKPEFHEHRALMDMLTRSYEDVLLSLDVTGVSLSGTGDNRGAIITGKMTSLTKQKMAVNTHRIIMSGSAYGFEEELTAIIEELTSEVYKYLFEGKKGAADLFTGSETDDEKDKEE